MILSSQYLWCQTMWTPGYHSPSAHYGLLAVFFIFPGDLQPLDVCSVKRKNEILRYSVVMAAYGFFGDVMQDSEKLRWMGPKRYDLSGFKKFMTNR